MTQFSNGFRKSNCFSRKMVSFWNTIEYSCLFRWRLLGYSCGLVNLTSGRPTASWGRFHQFRLIIQNTIFIWLNILFESDGVAIRRISHGTNCGLATGTQVRLLDNGLKLLNADVLVEGLVGSLLGWGLADLFLLQGRLVRLPDQPWVEEPD